jgi:hypothetical protein
MSITRPLEQGNETSELEWREAVLDLARAHGRSQRISSSGFGSFSSNSSLNSALM